MPSILVIDPESGEQIALVNKYPWDDLEAHRSGPDSMWCPWCTGRRTSTGQHAVVLMNGDNPQCRLFSNPCVAWSWYEAMKQSWTGVLLVKVIGNDMEGAQP